jgi:type IV pilus assembly protein PilB
MDAANFGAEHIDLSKVNFTPELLSCIPAKMVRKYRVLPIHQISDRTGIATTDPIDLNTIDTLVHNLNQEVEIYIADKDQLDAFIERLYGK